MLYSTAIISPETLSVRATTSDGTVFTIEANANQDRIGLLLTPVSELDREFEWKIEISTTATLEIKKPQEEVASLYESMIHKFTRVD